MLHSRFAYRSQPILRIILKDLHEHPADTCQVVQDGADVSMHFLIRDVAHSAKAGILDEEDLEKLSMLHSCAMHRLSSEYPVQPLTYLDAYAALPASAISQPMQDCASMISDLLRKLYRQRKILWRAHARNDSGADNLDKRITACLTWVLLRRVAFCYYRMKGDSYEEMQGTSEELRRDFDIPAEWQFRAEMANIRSGLISRRQYLRSEWYRQLREPVKLKWKDKPISVREVSTPILQDNMGTENCVICCDILTPPAIRTEVCGHCYCKECLQTWMHACQPRPTPGGARSEIVDGC